MSKYKWKEICQFKQDVCLLPNDIQFQLPENFNIILNKKSGGNWRTETNYDLDNTITPSYNYGYLFGTYLGDGNDNCLL